MENARVDVTDKEPLDFTPQVDVAACYLEIEGKLLLLSQALNKHEPGAWGVPGGKREIGETIEEAAIRELFEETGIQVTSSQMGYVGVLYIRKPQANFVFHMFRMSLDTIPNVSISKEHQGYIWATAQDLATLPLMGGALTSLKYYREKLHDSV